MITLVTVPAPLPRVIAFAPHEWEISVVIYSVSPRIAVAIIVTILRPECLDSSSLKRKESAAR